MPELRVTPVDPDQWEVYREVRLAMLADAPRAFGATYAEAAARTPADWRDRLVSGPTWFAHRAPEPAGEPAPAPSAAQVLGSVGAFTFPEQAAHETCVVAMWVRPGARGEGVGEALVHGLLEWAGASGLTRVTLDVAEENAPARALYGRCGFVPTGRTGVLPNDPSVAELEMAVDLRGGALDGPP